MDFNENKPIYLQIADRIMEKILNHTYTEGDRLPSVREAAADAGVNANTMMRTYTLLEQNGVIFNKRGIGFFVAESGRQRVWDIQYRELEDTDLKYIFGRLANFGYEPERLKQAYIDYLENREKQK